MTEPLPMAIDHAQAESEHGKVFAWTDDSAARLLNNSAIAETILGPMEFITAGAGPAVLGLHGGYGGFDQWFFFEPYISQGFRIVVPSRPGYLRTPLATGPTLEAQADACAALLDVLGIDRVIVHGISAGGPPALHFAMRHPGRTTALVLESAVTRRHLINPAQTGASWINTMVFSSPAVWLMNLFGKVMPGEAARHLVDTGQYLDGERLTAAATGILMSPRKGEFLARLLGTMGPYPLRGPGFENDLRQLAALPEDWALDGVRCPTLISHGTADTDVPFEIHARHAATAIAGAELHAVADAFHIIDLSERAPEAWQRKIGFCQTIVQQE